MCPPSGSRNSIWKTLTPACRRMECHFGPARYRFESTGTVPVRSAFTERHSTGSNAADGSGGICSFSDSNRPVTGTPSR